ncbi:MAG TPA: hypothetical protein VI248_29405 [Kineosporiaceae bacterium]
MPSVPWDDTGLSGLTASLDLLRAELRHVVAVLIWALIAGLAAAAGCWCCGYAIRSSWLGSGPPARHPVRGRRTAGQGAEELPEVVDGVDVATEAARGIRDIEDFLASVSPDRRRRPGEHDPHQP